jgi:dephospho-CoA kinase
MITLGLTGSIAAGKTTVADMFAAAGVPVFSADRAVHELYDGAAAGPVAAAFPEAVRDGRIDRDALAKAVLGDPRALARLEAIIHPLVRSRAGEFVEANRATGAGLVVLEIPLLFETGESYPVDRTVVVWADEEELRRRALARSGMDAGKLEALLARQLPQNEKRARADYAIDTGRPLEAVRNRVGEIIEACRAEPDR